MIRFRSFKYFSIFYTSSMLGETKSREFERNELKSSFFESYKFKAHSQLSRFLSVLKHGSRITIFSRVIIVLLVWLQVFGAPRMVVVSTRLFGVPSRVSVRFPSSLLVTVAWKLVVVPRGGTVLHFVGVVTLLLMETSWLLMTIILFLIILGTLTRLLILLFKFVAKCILHGWHIFHWSLVLFKIESGQFWIQFEKVPHLVRNNLFHFLVFSIFEPHLHQLLFRSKGKAHPDHIWLAKLLTNQSE